MIIFLTVCLLVAFPSFFLRVASNKFDEWLEILGLALLLFGLLLRVSSRGYKSEHSGNGHALVKTGPYALVRNPMYLGIFSSGLGLILLLFQWWILGLFMIFMLVRYVTLIVKEERLLVDCFGEEYLDYQKKVPRLFPHPSVLIQKDIRTYLPLKMAWMKREMNSIVVLLVMGLGLEYWEGTRLKNHPAAMTEMVIFVAMIALFFSFTIFLARSHEKNPD